MVLSRLIGMVFAFDEVRESRMVECGVQVDATFQAFCTSRSPPVGFSGLKAA